MDNDTTRSESPLSEVSSTLSAPTDFLDSPSPSPDRMNDHDNDSDDDADMTGTGTPSTVAIGAHPTKRRRTDNYEASTPKTPTIPPSPGGSISSDSSGSVPNSPSFASLGPTHPLSTAYAAFQANPSDPDASDYIQVTTCLWENCPTPNQGNMDNLVAHINEQHIVPRNKKFFCDWVGCARRSNAHLSAYALKAHMRSHTKEKPFMCSVPECDRSFTRSDALAKHMRTVHETEALRPSDPVPKSQTSKEVKPKLKLTFKKDIELPSLPTIGSASQEGISVRLASLDMEENTIEELRRAVDVDAVPMRLPVGEGYYPLDVWSGMEDYERELPPSQWFRLLRRQVLWAEEERRTLEEELDAVRVRVDDLDGKLVNREGAEDVGDVIRNEEWAVVESLLDRIGSASLASQPDGNGHVDGTVFEKVQGLERFKVAA